MSQQEEYMVKCTCGKLNPPGENYCTCGLNLRMFGTKVPVIKAKPMFSTEDLASFTVPLNTRPETKQSAAPQNDAPMENKPKVVPAYQPMLTDNKTDAFTQADGTAKADTDISKKTVREEDIFRNSKMLKSMKRKSLFLLPLFGSVSILFIVLSVMEGMPACLILPAFFIGTMIYIYHTSVSRIIKYCKNLSDPKAVLEEMEKLYFMPENAKGLHIDPNWCIFSRCGNSWAVATSDINWVYQHVLTYNIIFKIRTIRVHVGSDKKKIYAMNVFSKKQADEMLNVVAGYCPHAKIGYR